MHLIFVLEDFSVQTQSKTVPLAPKKKMNNITKFLMMIF